MMRYQQFKAEREYAAAPRPIRSRAAEINRGMKALTGLARRSSGNAIDVSLLCSYEIKKTYSLAFTGLGDAQQHEIIPNTLGRTLPADAPS